MNARLLIAALAAIALAGCKKDDDSPEQESTIEMRVVPKAGAEEIALTDTFTLSDGRKMRVMNLEFYMGDVTLTGGGNPETLQPVIFYTTRTTNHGELINTSFTFKSKKTSAEKLALGIGVPKKLNSPDNPDFDQSQYPNSHPLGIDQATYWDWADGYRFFVIEGRVDTTTAMNGAPTVPFSMHVGLDEYYKQLELGLPGTLQSDVTKLQLNLDVVALMKDINLQTHRNTHTATSDKNQMELTQKLVDNMPDAFSLTMKQ